MVDIKEATCLAGDVVGSFVPLIDVATTTIKKIIEICEAADYNQNICDVLTVRVKITGAALESLRRRKQKRKENDKVFHDAFHKFIYVLEEIKKFTTKISKIHGFKRYTTAISVKEKFIRLTDEYDKAMNDLHFTMAVANDEQRRIEKEALEEDIVEFEEYLKTMDKKVDNIDGKVDNILDGVQYIQNCINDKVVLHGAKKIDSIDLVSPPRPNPDDVRSGGSSNVVIRKIFKGQEVACKKISNTEEEMKSNPDVQKHLKILTILSDCNHILKFYGVSKIGIDSMMIFEWAGRGTLRELYEKKDINWHCKVRIALNICRGLVFLQQAEILHHDLKCENILMTHTLEPKIYKFDSARYDYGKTTSVGNKLDDTVPWKHNPHERLSFLKILDMLEELHSSISCMFDDDLPDLLPDKKLNLDGTKEDDLDDDLEIPDDVDPNISITLDEGVLAFRTGDHQKAWKCFEYHASNDNVTAKFWKGRYLWEGLHDDVKEREEGKALIKEAADRGNPDAQLRYAFILLKKLKQGDNQKIFMDYITKSAIEGENIAAQYHLGDIYYKGKCEIPENKSEGIKWLRKAALRNYSKAIKFLNELKIDIYGLENE
ncbi:14380_t:CDS:2 [Rhizophagus irregularis]|nr:14380_t:CDS:2 [Rhizophagus irregularis]